MKENDCHPCSNLWKLRRGGSICLEHLAPLGDISGCSDKRVPGLQGEIVWQARKFIKRITQSGK